MDESIRCPRPDGLPENLIWNNKFYDPENDIDPYVYDGSMSVEDFQCWQERVLDEEENEM